MICLLMWSNLAVAACEPTIAASTPTADFVTHGDGTVTHTKTGLMWKQCSEGKSGAGCAGTATKHTWQEALQAAEALNNGGGLAGYTDWRVPNIKELSSIVEEQCSSPAINSAVFPATLSAQYWSATTYRRGNGTTGWVVIVITGVDGQNTPKVGINGTFNVRLVRGGL